MITSISSKAQKIRQIDKWPNYRYYREKMYVGHLKIKRIKDLRIEKQEIFSMTDGPTTKVSYILDSLCKEFSLKILSNQNHISPTALQTDKVNYRVASLLKKAAIPKAIWFYGLWGVNNLIKRLEGFFTIFIPITTSTLRI